MESKPKPIYPLRKKSLIHFISFMVQNDQLQKLIKVKNI